MWRFDTTNWSSQPGGAPLLLLNIGLVESWSGYAVSIAGQDPARLLFPAVNEAGRTNLNLAAGTVQFWFSPYWSSRVLGGGGQGIRSIEWCPQLADGVGRYLIIGGPANGGPLEKEIFGERFSLYAWTGGANDTPQLLISDLRRYTVRPEGVDLIEVAGELRVVFVEDRFRGTGYATRNAVHWPASIVGTVQ